MHIESTHYSETPEAYEVFRKYVAMKRHFSDENYDYFKYKASVKVTPLSYRKRNDKDFFYKLSRKKDPENRILAHMLKDPDAWIRTIVEDDLTYVAWLKRQESFMYITKSELSKFDNLAEAVRVRNGEYPELLSAYVSGDVSLETIVALDVATNLMQYWKSRIDDTLYFPRLHSKCQKYKPFLSLDKSKINQLIQS